MAFKVIFYSITDEYSNPEYQSSLLAMKDDTFAIFRVFLEGESLVDFPFDFWIPSNKKRMLPWFERFNVVLGKSLCVSLRNHMSLNIGAFLFMQCIN